MIAGCAKYRTTVKCVSLKGLVGRMKKEDFLRLEFQNYSWQVLSQNAKTKEQAINKHLQLKSKVEVNIVNSTKPAYTTKGSSHRQVKPLSDQKSRQASPDNAHLKSPVPTKRTMEINVNDLSQYQQ